MDWIQVCIDTTPEGVEPVTERLRELGIEGAEIEDKAEMSDFLEHNRQYWDYVDEALARKLENMAGKARVKVYVADNAEGGKRLRALRGVMARLKAEDEEGAFGRLSVTLARMGDEDWANNWKQYFKPVYIGEKLLICPEWEKVPEDAGNRVVFKIDPGMTFGTGSHESTRLCLEAAGRYVKKGDRVLDLGCGSGILSITALLLGALRAVAVDIDPNCVHVAYRNAALNGIGREAYTVLSGDVLDGRKAARLLGKERYDIIFANIVADVIIALSGSIPKYIRQDGLFICSGIIDGRRQEVADALAAAGLTVRETAVERGWVCLVAAPAEVR